MKEKYVAFRMDEEVHHRAALKAKELGVTVSSLAKKFAYSIANNDLESNETTSDEKTDRLFFSLTQDEKETIKQYALAHGWSVSKEARFRVISSMSETSKLLPDELKKIRGLRTAIDAVGRNIRHMMFQSKKIEINDPDFMKEIETLNSYLEMAVKKIDDLQSASVDRWSFNRKGMKG
ncbi:hypothetical protein Pfra02_45950 [Pseudomonas fragi]|nr:hypothetical protein Pfra02_45950 [Pseudomonas fragi]